jgi:2-iminobutanoate/2-iminopropanoate deaminase
VESPVEPEPGTVDPLSSSDDDPQAARMVPAPSAPTPSEMNDRRVRLTQAESTMAPMSKPLGPYTPVVQAGDWIIVSGQLGLKDGALVEGGVAAQTAQAVENLKAQLATVGASLSDIAKTLCFLTDMDTFATFNEAYVAGFGDARPARSTIGVAALPAGGAVEIEAWAFRPSTGAK